MTDFRDIKERLMQEIAVWHERLVAGGTGALHTWREIEGSISALDNAAYARAYKQRHARCAAECHEELSMEMERRTRSLEYVQGCAKRGYQLAKDRAKEIEYLKAERDQARQDATTMTLANSDKRQELRRLKQDLEFTEHRRAQAEKAHERLQAERADARETILKMADGRVSVSRDECLRANRNAQRLLLDRDRLRSALETLADRYHAQMCYRKPRHQRQTCSQPPQAEKALAGESESGPPPSRAMMAVVEELEAAAQRRRAEGLPSVLFDDRKPKEPPEIEAVLMGTPIKCHASCGCDAVVDAGQCAYRFVHGGLTALLYASEACARKAATSP